MSNFPNRFARAIRLDKNLYEEVEHDSSALTQAMLVVALSSVAGGLGLSPYVPGLAGLFWGVLGAFLSWFMWAAVIYLVGGKLLATKDTQTDLGELLRVIGFAAAPGVFRILGIYGPAREIIILITGLWMFAAMVIAVRQALDFLSTMRAFVVCVLGILLQYAVLLLIYRMA